METTKKLHTGEFRIQPVPWVVCGRSSVQQLGHKVDELGARRALVVTGHSLAQTELLERVKLALGDRCAGVFSGAVQHVPRQCVIKGVGMTREVGADILISLGGSSACDTAKGINLVLAEAESAEEFFVKFNSADVIRASQFHKPKFSQIAIPTTLSGGEFRSDVGITDEERRCKDVFRDPMVTPRVVILDPEMTVLTPRELWGSTGIKSLSDGFMNLCSPEPLPLISALALQGIRIMNHYLVPSISEPLDFDTRAILQHGAWLSAYNAGVPGLVMMAALRHQIGAIYNIPHGVACTIIFSHCVNFTRPVVDPYLVPVAKALDLNFKDASDAADVTIKRVIEIISKLGLPTQLRNVGIPRDGLKVIAAAAMAPALQANLKPVESEEQLVDVLEAAW